MKKIIVFLFFIVPSLLMAQTTTNGNYGHFDVLTFTSNGSGIGNGGGITILTQLPPNSPNNTTIYINGFDNNFNSIGLQISWTFDGSTFISTAASSTGGWLPDIFLENVNGNLEISLGGSTEIIQLEISAFSDMSLVGSNTAWFDSWLISDGASGSGVQVSYFNKFGDVQAANVNAATFSGSQASVTHIGSQTAKIYDKLAIGAGNWTVTAPLHTKGVVRFEGYPNTTTTTTTKVLSTDASGNLVLENTYWQPHTNPSTIVYDGNVGIGITRSTTLNTSAYKLVVGGTIGATKVKVTQSGWADYVFAKDYKLQPLTEVEKFIKRNGHLEGVPTTKEVKENGVDLGETQVILLKKIEELTLHLIEQNKKLEEQQGRLDKQNLKIMSLEKEFYQNKKK